LYVKSNLRSKQLYIYTTNSKTVNHVKDGRSGPIYFSTWFASLFTIPDSSTGRIEVGICKTTVTVKEVSSFKCSYDVIPSEFMTGNMEDEADWVEFYAKVTTKGVENYNTGTVLVYCSWCNAEALGPGPQE